MRQNRSWERPNQAGNSLTSKHGGGMKKCNGWFERKKWLSRHGGTQLRADLNHYQSLKLAAKRAVATAKSHYYQELYDQLDTQDGANNIYCLAKSHHRSTQDINRNWRKLPISNTSGPWLPPFPMHEQELTRYGWSGDRSLGSCAIRKSQITSRQRSIRPSCAQLLSMEPDVGPSNTS